MPADYRGFGGLSWDDGIRLRSCRAGKKRALTRLCGPRVVALNKTDNGAGYKNPAGGLEMPLEMKDRGAFICTLSRFKRIGAAVSKSV